MRRFSILALLAVVLAFTAACTNKKAVNPLANVGSKQPDKVLFDRAMDALKHNRFDVARMTLQTMINTYPDSEYVARAKLAVADSWYAEGGSTALQQAEIEYKDFKTFFPNMPEAAEAQFKVANIHYQQMEKPDRDYTHAMRAEDEYRSLIQEFPDSKLLPEAKQRLREVQQVLGEREYEIGHFYYLREAYPAAIARLQTLIERYPLFSGADNALYLLGQCYEGQIDLLRRNAKMEETAKGKGIALFTKNAAEAYDRIIQRYPAEERAMDAKARLEALHQPVPKPTRAAWELSQKEVACRQAEGTMSGVIGAFTKHPSTGNAACIGEPPLTDPAPVSAIQVVDTLTRALTGASTSSDGKVTVQTANITPGANQEAPRSDAPPQSTQVPPPSDVPATDAGTPSSDSAGNDAGEAKSNVPDPNELKPNVAPDPNALPPLQQNNEVASTSGSTSASSSKSTENPDDLVDFASSKKKKKKGLGKLNPF